MIFNFRSTKKIPVLSLVVIVFAFLGSCQKDTISENGNEISIFDSKVKANEEAATTVNNAIFPHSYQGFNHDIGPWGDKDSGEEDAGWCGAITLKDRNNSDLAPSAGQGYATVSFGDCNSFWFNAGFENGSGPATIDPSLWSQIWPESGFIHELDIYLDPSNYDDGLVFSLYFGLYYDALAYPFTYFEASVEKDSDHLLVNGDYEVSMSGWYTFKQAYDKDEEGNLMVIFELEKNNKMVYSSEMTQTVYGVPTSDYNVDDIYEEGNVIGSGYMWFPYIASGVELPIDEYRLHAGK